MGKSESDKLQKIIKKMQTVMHLFLDSGVKQMIISNKTNCCHAANSMSVTDNTCYTKSGNIQIKE